MSDKFRKYVFWFAQEHVDFRHAEILSIAKLFNIIPGNITRHSEDAPYWIVELNNEQQVHEIANRSVSLKCCLELWAHSKSVVNLHKDMLQTLKENPHYSQYFKKDLSFKVTVETFCKHLTQKEKINKIEEFSYLPIEGPVKLNDPNVEFYYCEYYGLDSNNIPVEPSEVLFGRLVCNGQRNLINRISLKTRKFIGNTSMDAQLSLLAANQALIQKGSIVLDPFAGSGSLLVAAAMFGGYVLGTDIDYLMLHGRTRPSRITQKVREKDEGILANMKQYSCVSQYLDVIVADCSRPLWRDNMKLDAIITDPPYGIRESMERVGIDSNSSIKQEEQVNSDTSTKPKVKYSKNKKQECEEHFPTKVDYNLPQLYADLLEFASKHLIPGGRLICWFPVFRDDYSEQSLPKHDKLVLVSNSEQVLSKYTARRMLTYERLDEQNTNEIKTSKVEANEISDFRYKYFSHGEETRKEKRMKKAEEKERGRLEKIRRQMLVENQNDF